MKKSLLKVTENNPGVRFVVVAKRECGFPVGIRIDPNPKLVCFASIDHWRERTKDILEFENGKFRFIEGCE